uniref:Ty3 transposon capsid-like protein domain-containing protein n=1 Tax=Salix viminalis TaxID=40686 RepID=A0A6N2NI39_SALVM
MGSLRDYQSEFEKLGNRVRGWTQKALVGTFMGGLKPEIAEGIRMFKPQSLKEAISLARMKDEQMKKQRQFLRPNQTTRAPLALPAATLNTVISRHCGNSLDWQLNASMIASILGTGENH